MGVDEAMVFRGALTAGAVSSAFTYTFGTLSVEALENFTNPFATILIGVRSL